MKEEGKKKKKGKRSRQTTEVTSPQSVLDDSDAHRHRQIEREEE